MKKNLKIGLHDAEKNHFKNKNFPNYALMKISAWHKGQGDKEGDTMIPRGTGENKEHSNRVIRDVLEQWDVIIGKTTNRKGEKEHEVD